MSSKYRGMHYPEPPHFGWPLWFYKLWKRFMCKRENHLLSEVYSPGGPPDHYLVCDACQLMVIIESIDTKYTTTTPPNRGPAADT